MLGAHSPKPTGVLALRKRKLRDDRRVIGLGKDRVGRERDRLVAKDFIVRGGQLPERQQRSRDQDVIEHHGTTAVIQTKACGRRNVALTRNHQSRYKVWITGVLDISADRGTPVYATADGTISQASFSGAYGNLVVVEHQFGIETRYGHLSAFRTMRGQTVKRGELIGLVGATGRATGPHLHYEVRVNGRILNPLSFLLNSRRGANGN